MLTRRAVLTSAALLPIATVFGSALCAEPNNASDRLAASPIDPATAILIDEAGLHATAAARQATLRGPVHRLTPDLSQLYFQDLVPQWHAHGVRPLYGLTRATPALILEQLALEFGQRLVYANRSEPDTSLGRREAELARLLDRLLLAPIPSQPLANRDVVRGALLTEDPALFAWCLAPVRKSILTPNRVATT